MEFFLRRPIKFDKEVLKQMDIECFLHNWTDDMWAQAINQLEVRIVMNYIKPVAFYAGHISEGDKSVFRVSKFGVRRSARGKGMSRSIMSEIRKWCQTRGGVSKLEFLLPEDMCRPGESGYVAEWAHKMGFTATGRVERDMFVSHGDTFDGFYFESLL